jgi:hypothetical protein
VKRDSSIRLSNIVDNGSLGTILKAVFIVECSFGMNRNNFTNQMKVVALGVRLKCFLLLPVRNSPLLPPFEVPQSLVYIPILHGTLEMGRKNEIMC